MIYSNSKFNAEVIKTQPCPLAGGGLETQATAAIKKIRACAFNSWKSVGLILVSVVLPALQGVRISGGRGHFDHAKVPYASVLIENRSPQKYYIQPVQTRTLVVHI
jgi:hypothetical protein